MRLSKAWLQAWEADKTVLHNRRERTWNSVGPGSGAGSRKMAEDFAWQDAPPPCNNPPEKSIDLRDVS